MLRARGISRSFGGQVVLDGVSLAVDGRDRVGVVGPNGAGKTTLLRVLAGLDVPDAGVVERAPRSLTVGYLPQEPDALAGESVGAYLARRTGVAAASDELDRRTAQLSEEPGSHEAYADALDRFVALGGGDLEARAAAVLASVGFGHAAGDPDPATRFAQTTSSLSGGEAARLALAAILLSRCDVLLLDEPTNNLDFAGLDLLESFVDAFPGAVVAVSHDRAFLDRTVHRVVEVDDHSHHLREFAGGWTTYVAARDLARAQQYEAHDRYVTERARLRERQRTQQQWTERGVRRAKTSSEPDKNLKAARRARSEKQAAKIKATERKLDHLEAVDKPWEGWRLQLALAPTARSGQVVVRLDGAVVETSPSDGPGGEPFRLGPVDLEVGWQDRLAILGPNGSGKTTLLRALLGELPLTAGRRWSGPGVRLGAMDQGRTEHAGSAPVLATFQQATGMATSEARSLLAKFGLGADHVERAGRDLSPGERSRARLATLMAQGVNCLVLDEPTNHLDVEAIEQLESALATFEGTLLLVSHDRRFLESVAVGRTLELDGRGSLASRPA
ncbi:MAG TPA: ABC-F family ATP-binding cassette domain-containing protein [Acidimicrobiales bacterium]|nr:ABC-F family ATP-binding cassette domain-containing protein [Acidimicrobiales bacterium]